MRFIIIQFIGQMKVFFFFFFLIRVDEGDNLEQLPNIKPSSASTNAEKSNSITDSTSPHPQK